MKHGEESWFQNINLDYMIYEDSQTVNLIIKHAKDELTPREMQRLFNAASVGDMNGVYAYLASLKGDYRLAL